MGVLARLGRWQHDDGTELTRAAFSIGGSADVAQIRNFPSEVAAAWGLQHATTVDRATAMRVPAIRRGRQIICGTIGAQPLVAHATRNGELVDVTDELPLLAQPDPTTTRQWVLTWTVDDLLFYGISWWRRRASDYRGYPTQVERLSPERVTVDIDRQAVYVDGVQVTDDSQLIRFDGPDEGLLCYAANAVTTAQQLDRAVQRNSDGLPPLDLLTPAEGSQPLSAEPRSAGDGTDRSEIDALLDAWVEARRTRSTAFLNAAVTHQGVGFDPEQLGLSAAREQQRAELANLLNLSPRYVNAPTGDSMTYSTIAAERADLVDLSLAGYIAAIEQRLSMGDVTPRGTTVRLDLGRFLQGDQATAIDTATKAVAIGAMTGAETRTDVLGRAPLPNPGGGPGRPGPAPTPPTNGGPTG